MKLNTFMSIAAIVSFLFGLAFLLIPVQTMSAYGVTLDISGQFIGRYFGSALVGVAVLTWFARNAKQDNEAMRAIILGDFVLCITGFIASLFDVFYGAGNTLVWTTVLVYLLLGVGFGYYQFKK
jgi:hypothetical protein